LVTLPFRFLAVLFGSLMLSILIECIGLHLFWPEESWRHSERMLQHELDQLSGHFRQSLLVQEPARTAQLLVTRTYNTLFIETGAADWGQGASSQARSDSVVKPSFKRLLGLVYAHIEVYVRAALYTVLTFLVRLLVLFLSLPLFVMAVLVGLIDGLVRRDLRKFGAGRESGFLYHRARATLLPLFVLPLVIYLALPISVHPVFALLPGAVLLAVAVDVTAGSFKKYL
jgi:integrating conjugative element membrane protein (TIGR03747 family)